MAKVQCKWLSYGKSTPEFASCRLLLKSMQVEFLCIKAGLWNTYRVYFPSVMGDIIDIYRKIMLIFCMTVRLMGAVQ